MAKIFNEISTPCQLIANVGDKTTVVNTGLAVVTLLDDDTLKSMEGLSKAAKQKLSESQFGILPGQSKSVSAGSYNVDFTSYIGRSVVIMIDNKE